MILPQTERRRQKELFADARRLYRQTGLAPDVLEKIDAILRSIANPFTLMVVGEYNAGKSALINALLGERVVETGVTPTTETIQVVTSAAKPSTPKLTYISSNHELVRDMDIVDTPGTNSIFKHHQQVAEDFVKTADFIIFVTSAERPLTDTELRFLDLIKGEWQRKLILCLSKCDLVPENKLAEIRQYVHTHLLRLLGEDVRIFSVASLADGLPAAKTTGIDRLRNFIISHLSSHRRIRLKLNSPVLALKKVVTQGAAKQKPLLPLIDQEMRAISRLNSFIDQAAKDVLRGVDEQKAVIDDIFKRFASRMMDFIDKTVTIGFVLQQKLGRKHIRLELENILSAKDNPLLQLNNAVDRTVSYTSRACKTMRNQAVEFITENLNKERFGGDVARKKAFIDREKELYYTALERSRAYREVDLDTESNQLKSNIEAGFRSFLTMEGLAVGAGITLIALLQGAVFDMSGILLSLTLAGYGFVLFPYKRRKMKKAMQVKIAGLNAEMWRITQQEMASYVKEVVDDVRAIFSSHSRFLGEEKTKIADFLQHLQEITERIEQFVFDINRTYDR